jgi:hypothetical protein
VIAAGALVGVGVLAAVGFGASRWLAAGPAPDTAAPAASAPASATAAPPASVEVSPTSGPKHPREMTLDELDTRMKATGLRITGRLEQHREPRWWQVSYDAPGGQGVAFAYLIELPIPADAGPVGQPIYTLPTIATWIKGDRAIGQELVYGITDNWVLCIAGHDAKKITAAFEVLAADIQLTVRGNSFSGPDPATNAADSKVTWTAKSLDQLSFMELDFRIRATGAESQLAPKPAAWSFTVKLQNHKGELAFFGLESPEGQQALASHLAKLGARPYAYAQDPKAAMVTSGTGELSKAAFLERVLEGITVPVLSGPVGGPKR